MSELTKLFFIILATIIGTIWSGYVLSIIWAWFVVPIFHLPALQLVQAIGVSLVVSYMTHQIGRKTKDEDVIYMYTVVMVKPGLALLVGFIVKQWM